MQYNLKCPHCGGLSATEILPLIGQHCLCPFCDQKFDFTMSNVVISSMDLGVDGLYSSSVVLESADGCDHIVQSVDNAPLEHDMSEAVVSSPETIEPFEPVAAADAAVAELEPVDDAEIVPASADEPPAESASPMMAEASEPVAAADAAVAELEPVEDAEIVPTSFEEPPAESASPMVAEAEDSNDDVFLSFRDSLSIPENDTVLDYESGTVFFEPNCICDIPGDNNVDDAFAEDLLPSKEEILCDLVNFAGTLPSPA